MSGFANVIGRWFRRHTVEHMLEQNAATKGAGSKPPLWSPQDSGAAAGARQYWDQPEIFEGMVGFTNLCKIARAADNLEDLLFEGCVDNDEDDVGIELKADDESAPLVHSALQELRTALMPYRNARDLCRARR